MFEKPNTFAQSASVGRVDEGLRQHMLRVYNLMVTALGLTGVVAYIIGSSPEMLMAVAPYQLIFAFGTLGMAIAFGFIAPKLSVGGATAYFYGFAALMGVTIAFYFAVYTSESIARAFFMAAALFGAMSLYGYTTKKDISGWAPVLMIGMLVAIGASILNLFMGSTPLMMAVSAAVVMLSAGITAYETQQIRDVYYQGHGREALAKISIMGALTLYISFINMFLAMLRLFGSQRQ